MKIIICVDKKNGMLFNSRRQSQDSVLRQRVIEKSKDTKLWMNSYSAKQFADCNDLCISENFLAEAQSGEYCFVETDCLPKENIEEITIFKWNRNYQADFFFDFDLKANGFKMASSTSFVGNSHEKITEEIYVKK